MTKPGRQTVRAAGGVLTRPGPAGRTEVVVVHRPAYDDWSFPKGKLNRGESLEAAAVREVTEETGLAALPVRPLGGTEYVDHLGRPKTVSYWLMSVVGGRFNPNGEVDELRWLSITEAKELLTYPHDRAILDDLTA